MLKKFVVNKKAKAQGLVEFALILTLLLTLLYGILETGRLMFIYASTVTAARQATRYGSATGTSPATGNPLYYKDCANIRAAAQKVGFLNTFTNANIIITYDKGPGTTNLNWTCVTTFSGTDQGGIAATGDRIKVCVSTTWLPIIGALVPLNWGGVTNCSGVVTPNAITKSSERTIISSISIGVVDPGTGPLPGSGGLTLETTALSEPPTSPTTYSQVGQVITYKYKMTNTGSEDLLGAFTVASNNVFATCGAGYIIYPGKTLICYGYYTITQADLDAGSVVNIATASTSGASSNTITTTINSTQTRKLTLAISASSPIAKLNDVITYTYTLTNSGNVTLTSPVYTVTDTLAAAPSNVTCPSPASLAPGGIITCTNKTHTILAADVTAKIYVNTATLTYAQMSPTVQTATATVDTATLVLTITATPSTADKALQVIAYKYIVQNNYTAVISNPVIAASNTRFNATCPISIPVGGFVECTVNYTVTQTDMDTGSAALTNTATASGNSGGVTSRSVNGSVPVAQTPALTLAITSAIPTPSTVGSTTTSITFTYLVTNSGNITLTPAVTSTVRNGAFTITPVTCSPAGPILPLATTTCTGTYTVIQADIDINYVVNKATATANAGAVSSTEQTVTVPVYNGERLALGITASKVGTEIKYAYTLTNTGNVPITLPTPYNITSTIANKTAPTTALPPSPVTFICAPATTTPIAINSSVACTTGYSFTTTLATGILVNTSTAQAPPFTDSTVITGSVEYDVNLYCKISHSGAIPENIALLTSTWSIYNKTSPASILHITSITVYWESQGIYLKEITLGGTSVWSGSTQQNGITIDKGTGGTSGATADWADGLNLNASPQKTDMTLRFSAATYNIRVVLAFSESDCSAGLDSGYAPQREPIVKGAIESSVITRSLTVPTITGSGNATCTKTIVDYTCSMLNGSGAIAVGAYSTAGVNNKVCVSAASPTGVVANSGVTEKTTFTFSALPPETIFNIQIIAQGNNTVPSGYTCYP